MLKMYVPAQIVCREWSSIMNEFILSYLEDTCEQYFIFVYFLRHQSEPPPPTHPSIEPTVKKSSPMHELNYILNYDLWM